MRILFAGTPEAAVPSLDALVASDHEVVAVLTRPDAPVGRGRRMAPSPVRARAAELGIEVLTPRSPREVEFQDRLRAIAPDCCAVVAYGALIPQPVLDVPEHGWVNLHFSVLPAWRGAAPVQRAVMSGDTVTGASTFQLEAGLDTGPVFGVMTESIREHDTAGDITERLAEGGAALLVATMDGIADGSLTAVPQPTEGVSHAPKVEVADAEVDWSMSALGVDRLVRGCTPAPGAWTTFRGERLGLGPVDLDRGGTGVQRTDELPPVPPGALHVTKHAVHVGTATDPVRLGEVRPQGRKQMAAADWARGVRIDADEVLGGA
jgi:methionyl-tRNA formyltransferase